MPTESHILDALRTIIDPDLNQDIVSLGFVKEMRIDGGRVAFTIELTTPACPVKEEFRRVAVERVRAVPGVTDVAVQITSQVRSGAAPQRADVLVGVKNVVAVASGKGGVGKSTVAANLACALHQQGATVGLLDADIYGPSIPMMFGVPKPPIAADAQNRILPWTEHGVRLMSIGFLVDETAPVIWRGPMVHSILTQFLSQVHWGELDYVLIDLPPGTGDAQLTLTQVAPLTGAVIVTTPQDVAFTIASKGLKMFEQVKVPVLGWIENMSFFICPHCDRPSDIFRHGEAGRAVQASGPPLLGKVPLDPQVVADADAGVPTVTAHPDAAAAQAYRAIAGQLAAQLSILAMRADGQVANLSPDR
ncbi:MAG: Mrp/NBP35 family ATP-binding protein [Deltaproteobacteria bacterium]|nr:Mrp/NBP35 family ATP-binding protein [Deltaproteobacteria bacterium]